MRKRFVAVREDRPGAEWLARFEAGREEAERWYLGEGRGPPPNAATCRAALLRHMPELAAHYDRVCDLVGEDEMAHRILSHYRPAAAPAGCSQAVWLGEGGPALVRNYDYPPAIVSDRFEMTAWSGRRVIAKAQRPWGGCLDGINEDGLAASMTLGGRSAPGEGFSIILMLRYVLETCRRVEDAVAALLRIPVAQPQNVTLLDRTGTYATLFLGPDRTPAVTALRACTNHQERAGPSNSTERQDVLLAALEEPGMTLPDLVARFLRPPLHVRGAGSPTVHTALYRPAEGRVDYLWPGNTWSQSFRAFEPGEYEHDFAPFGPGSA